MLHGGHRNWVDVYLYNQRQVRETHKEVPSIPSHDGRGNHSPLPREHLFLQGHSKTPARSLRVFFLLLSPSLPLCHGGGLHRPPTVHRSVPCPMLPCFLQQSSYFSR